jgi:hypothetical protein
LSLGEIGAGSEAGLSGGVINGSSNRGRDRLLKKKSEGETFDSAKGVGNSESFLPWARETVEMTASVVVGE